MSLGDPAKGEMLNGNSDEIISKIENQPLREFSHVVIPLRLLPNSWDDYLKLQKKIAVLIPEEDKRPTIDLIVSESENDLPKYSIGIAGGTGPLADAELLKLVMRKLEALDKPIQWKDFAINVFSAPPPRTLHEEVERGVPYLENMMEFATRGHRKYFLASNTAHSRIGSFKKMVGMTWLRQMSLGNSHEVIDLVDHVVKKVAHNTPAQQIQVLVLGTLEAYHNRLYAPYLEKSGIKKFSFVNSLSRAQELQSYINLAKTGKLQEAGDRIAQFLFQEVEGFPKQEPEIKIILGCTELPLALNKERMRLIEQEFKAKTGQQVSIYDSEEIFSAAIVDVIEQMRSSNPDLYLH